jgi:hypothetical protein
MKVCNSLKLKKMKNSRIIYYDSFSIAVINPSGKIRRLYTPFMVKCISKIDDIHENCSVYVDEVFKDPDEMIVYKIGGNLYPYSSFRISINF